jgi:hypothetical protein
MDELETLRIYEIDYSVSPGGINMFEVYPDIDSPNDTTGYPLYETESLTEAVTWCYNQGCNFIVYTLAQHDKEFA